jgi:hypothetical protein
MGAVIKTFNWIFVVLIVASSEFTWAGQFPAQARLFAGVLSAKPSEVNQEMALQGLKEFNSIPQYGVEITYPAAKYFDAGIRYQKRYLKNEEVNPTPNSGYNALLDQDTILLIARIPFLKTENVRLDVFGGVGGSNTTFKIKSATQDGELSRRESNDWLASLNTAVGGSVAIGAKNFYLVFEAGVESNKVDSFKRSGNINTNIQKVDLSGGYFTVGLMFDGITATTK